MTPRLSAPPERPGPRSRPARIARHLRTDPAVCWPVLLLFGALTFAGWMVSGLATVEFDERCNHRIVDGGGDLLETRRRAFPPAVFCEFEGGQVTAGAAGWGAVALWAVFFGAALSAATGLLTAFLGPPPDTENARGIRIRRCLLLLLISAATFVTAYAPAARDLLPGGEGCAGDGEWQGHPPQTLDRSLLPPQATCRFSSGLTRPFLPEGISALVALLALPVVLYAVGLVLALCARRRSV